MLDHSGRLSYATASLYGMLASTKEEIRGEHLSATRLANVHPAIDEDVTKVLETGTPRQTAIRYESDDGVAVQMMVWLVPHADDDGKVIGVCGSLVPLSG